MDDALAVLIFLLLMFLSFLVIYVWYSWALSRVFHKVGTDGWRGWVPILNEMTLFERGGVAGWKALFLFMPVIQLYGLYLKFQAAQHIGARFGHGNGVAVLAIVFAPLWATLVGGKDRDDAHLAGQRISSVVGHRQMAGAMAGVKEQAGSPAGTSPATAAAAPGPGAPTSPAPAPPAPAAGQPAWDSAGQGTPAVGLSAPPPPAPGVAASSVAPAQAAPVEPAPPRSPMPEPAPPDKPVSGEVATSEPILVHNPWARPATTEPTVTQDSPSPALSTEVPAWLDDLESASAAGSLSADHQEDDGATIVVDRRPRVQWHLNVDGASPLPLAGEHVVLGRKPSVSVPGSQTLTVPDTTRTLSKSHARLDLVDGEWTITDLDSTNGVMLVDEAGEESLITPGEAVPVTGRFILGKVGMHISFEQDGE